MISQLLETLNMSVGMNWGDKAFQMGGSAVICVTTHSTGRIVGWTGERAPSSVTGECGTFDP